MDAETAVARTALLVWLGPAADELSAEQIDRLYQEAEAIEARFPHPDDEYLRDAALSAAVQWVLGEITLAQAAQQLVDARVAARRASVVAQEVAALAVADGMSEVNAARAVGIDRMTLRKVLGKL